MICGKTFRCFICLMLPIKMSNEHEFEQRERAAFSKSLGQGRGSWL